jgi:glycosyltransferase involved in cell wall biosynthesis
MKIGLIAPPWLPVPPPEYGGTENVIDSLARGFVARGHDVILAASRDSTCPVPIVGPFEYAPTEHIGRSTHELRHVIEAYSALGDRDIVHDHSLLGPFVAGARRNSPPLVTTNHGPFDADLEPLYRLLGRDVSVVAVSHHQASTAPDVPVGAIIHHGIDVERFPVGRGDGGYLLFLGRVNPTKGIVPAIRAARAAGTALRIAAKCREPAERDYFEQQIRPLLGGDVEFVGEVGGVDKLELLGGAAALLNPIAWPEPFGLVMIEALACGTPVIATHNGAAPEIVRDGLTGFIGNTHDELVDAINQVGTIDRAACRSDTEVRFSAERMVDEHLAHYERVLGDDSNSSTRYESAPGEITPHYLVRSTSE